MGTGCGEDYRKEKVTAVFREVLESYSILLSYCMGGLSFESSWCLSDECLGGGFPYRISWCVMNFVVVLQCNHRTYLDEWDIENEVTVVQQLRECQICTLAGGDSLTSIWILTNCILRTSITLTLWEIWKWETALSTVSFKDRSTYSVHFCILHNIKDQMTI